MEMEGGLQQNKIETEAFWEKELNNFNNFKKDLSLESFPKPVDQLREFIKTKYPNLESGSPEYKEKWSEIAKAFEYKGNLENPYIQKYKPDISKEEYEKDRIDLKEKMKAFSFVENKKKNNEENDLDQKKENENFIQKLNGDENFKNEIIEKFKKEGRGDDISIYRKVNLMFESGLISINDIVQGFSRDWKSIGSDIKKFSPEIIGKLKDGTVITQDKREISFSNFLDDTYNNKNKELNDGLETQEKNYQGQILDFAKAVELIPLFWAMGKQPDNEFKKLWKEKFDILKKVLSEKDGMSAYFLDRVDLKSALSVDKKILPEIILPGLKKDLKPGGSYFESSVKVIEKMVNENLISREEADKMYDEVLK
jgi:hypothetical protein